MSSKIEFVGSYASGKSTVIKELNRLHSYHFMTIGTCNVFSKFYGRLVGNANLIYHGIGLEKRWADFLSEAWSISKFNSYLTSDILIDEGAISRLWSLYCRDLITISNVSYLLKIVPLPDAVMFFHADTSIRMKRNLRRDNKKHIQRDRYKKWLLQSIPDLLDEGLSTNEAISLILSSSTIIQPSVSIDKLRIEAKRVISKIDPIEEPKLLTESIRAHKFINTISLSKSKVFIYDTSHSTIEEVVGAVNLNIKSI